MLKTLINSLTNVKKEYVHSVQFKITRDSLNVFTSDKDDYKQVKSLFFLLDVRFHTYTLPEEKPKHVVFRRLHVIKTKEIIKELMSHQIVANRIIQMKSKILEQYAYSTNHNIIPAYMVTLKHHDDLRKIYKTNNLFLFKIKWEKYCNKRKITQCFRCQQFGHE